LQKSAESHRGLQLAERVMFVCKKFLCLLLALLIVLAVCSTISDDTPAATNTQDPTISEPVIKSDFCYLSANAHDLTSFQRIV